MNKNGGIIKRIKTGVKFIIKYGVSLIAAFYWPRRVLNAVYVELTPSQRNVFYRYFAKIFRDNHILGSNGIWKVIFANKSILMPLTPERFWLDWDLAVSIVGHEKEINETYEALIVSSEKPELFIDIGANYGTHSLLFLIHQIKTITFEPNSSCHAYFRELCKLNQVTPRLEPVALGKKNGYVELSYPKRETWLGSTDTEITKRLTLAQELVTEKVEQKTVDDYFPQILYNRTLIKIDTEGNELNVLHGATRTLQEAKPITIFESFGHSERTELFEFLNAKNYRIYDLPWNPAGNAQPLTRHHFIASSSTNFIAVPMSREIMGLR